VAAGFGFFSGRATAALAASGPAAARSPAVTTDATRIRLSISHRPVIAIERLPVMPR
jgi:hypothetical protein